MLFLATIPLSPLYLILKNIKSLYGQPEYLGFFFLLSAFLLFAGERFAKKQLETDVNKKKWSHALFIGIAQAIAILPAVSRSGATIAAARYLGWQREQAAKFSFFLAIPTILGGLLIEGKEIIHTGFGDISSYAYLVGFLSAFFVGYFVLKGLLKLFKTVSLKPFAVYCFFIGIFTIVYTQAR
jgi:undecaprenyl-diphosphatase